MILKKTEMVIIRIFGISLILMGVFLAYGLKGTYLAILFGTKTEATIVAVEQVNNKRFTYVYYPVFQFTHLKKTIKAADRSRDIDKNSVGIKEFIFYSEKYGVSRRIAPTTIVFSFISVCFIFFGFVSLFYKGRI